MAIYANHSSRPNARLERRRVEQPGPYDLRYHMLVITTEVVPAGGEIRINYDGGREKNYWNGKPPPAETPWRAIRLRAPPPSGLGIRLAHNSLQLPLLPTGASAAGETEWGVDPPDIELSVERPVEWSGDAGGDARLGALVHVLNAIRNPSCWSLVATHLPGRKASECRERATLLGLLHGTPHSTAGARAATTLLPAARDGVVRASASAPTPTVPSQPQHAPAPRLERREDEAEPRAAPNTQPRAPRDASAPGYTIAVKVPENAQPGQALIVTNPHGGPKLRLTIPAGAIAGTRLRITLPYRDAPQAGPGA
jgi:hypothetical protein